MSGGVLVGWLASHGRIFYNIKEKSRKKSKLHFWFKYTHTRTTQMLKAYKGK